MGSNKTGRNEACPCGSGKKYKHCCGRIGARPLTDPVADLTQAMRGRTFASLDEANAFAAQYTQQANETGRDHFDGLSSSQLSTLLYAPLDSPHSLEFVQSGVAATNAPIMVLFNALAAAIGEHGLRATAKGNLPRAFCQLAHREYLRVVGSDPAMDLIQARVNREADFQYLHVTRLVAERAGLVRKYKSRFLLTRRARTLQTNDGIYPRLLTTHATQYNWAYGDGFADLRLVQQAFAFTLYLLQRHGAQEQSSRFYEDAFIRAFPSVLEDMETNPWLSAEDRLRRCYTLRTLERFAAFFGLIQLRGCRNELAAPECHIAKTPLLDATVRFYLD